MASGLEGAPWKRHVIDASSRGADGTRLMDVNRDGHLDIATGWEQGGLVRVYLNPGPKAVRKAWPAVSVGQARNVEDAVFADLDHDGAMDIISSCEGRTRSLYIHWAPSAPADYRNPKAWTTELLPASEGMMMWMYSEPLQIDGKHGIDVIAGGKGPNAAIGWWQSPPNPRDLDAWTWHPIRPCGWIMSLTATDMDGDGDQDILASDRKGPRSAALWLENPGNATDQWKEHPIGARGREVMFLSEADLDQDGLIDVIDAIRPRQIAFFQRLNQAGTQWREQFIEIPEISGDSKAVSAGDINLDGKMDLLYSCERANGEKHGVIWMEYRQSPAEKHWIAHDISGPEGVKHDLIPLLDLDGDGDLDAITCEEKTNLGVIWFENPHR